MAICDICKQEMMTADGCTFTHVKKVKGQKHVLRDTSNLGETERCHDCGAKLGQPHHLGCDNEICPFCGGQMAFCECELMLARMRRKS